MINLSMLRRALAFVLPVALPVQPGSYSPHEELRVPERCDDLPRVGVELLLPGGFDHLQWYGRGPHESYPDRARGAGLGRYRSTVAEHAGSAVRAGDPASTSVLHWLAADGRYEKTKCGGDEQNAFHVSRS